MSDGPICMGPEKPGEANATVTGNAPNLDNVITYLDEPVEAVRYVSRDLGGFRSHSWRQPLKPTAGYAIRCSTEKGSVHAFSLNRNKLFNYPELGIFQNVTVTRLGGSHYHMPNLTLYKIRIIPAA